MYEDEAHPARLALAKQGAGHAEKYQPKDHMNVYTRENGKLAKWNVESDCHMVAIHSVRTFAEVGQRFPCSRLSTVAMQNSNKINKPL